MPRETVSDPLKASRGYSRLSSHEALLIFPTLSFRLWCRFLIFVDPLLLSMTRGEHKISARPDAGGGVGGSETLREFLNS